jgi:hypothetical protein
MSDLILLIPLCALVYVGIVIGINIGKKMRRWGEK